jgi:pimeloyl-ACP methyl ester carboxylesterase
MNLEHIVKMPTGDRKPTPVLVVAAGRDAKFPIAEERCLAKAYGAQFVLFEGQGHSLMVEWHCQEVAGEIRAWFEQVRHMSQ